MTCESGCSPSWWQSAKPLTERAEVKEPPCSRSSPRRRSADRGMPPASMRASDSCCSRSRSAAGSPSSGPEALISQQQPVQGRPRLGAALGLGAQLLGERGDPLAGAQGLALDGDSADLTLAKALDAIVLDGELIADPGARGAELDEQIGRASCRERV